MDKCMLSEIRNHENILVFPIEPRFAHNARKLKHLPENDHRNAPKIHQSIIKMLPKYIKIDWKLESGDRKPGKRIAGA